MAQFLPTMTEGGLASGFVIPRGTVLRGQMPRGEQTACQFRTAHNVTLWPIEVLEARYASQAPDLPLNTLPLAEPVRGVLRLRLRAAASLPFQQIALDRLNLFLAGGDEVALKLYELIIGSGLGVLVAPPARPVPWFEWLGRDAIQPVGFDSDQALIPYTGRSFSGFRLLHEYFAFPERFRFVELLGLRKALARHPGDEIDVVVPLARADAQLGPLVDKAELRAPLHARHQPHPATRRSNPRHRPAGRAPGRGGPHEAHGFRGVLGPAGHRIRRRGAGGTGVPSILRVSERGRSRVWPGLLHVPSRAARHVRGTAPGRGANQLHRQRGVSLAGGLPRGALFREDPPAGCRGAGHQPRSAAPDARWHRCRLHAGDLGAGRRDPVSAGAHSATAGSRRGRDDVAADQPPFPQLPDHDRSRPSAGSGGAARVPGALCRPGRRGRGRGNFSPASARRATRDRCAQNPASSRARAHRVRARIGDPASPWTRPHSWGQAPSYWVRCSSSSSGASPR